MSQASAGRVRVLHFTRFINRCDFIDTVIRFADPGRFHMMACTLTDRSNIEAPGYDAHGIPHWVLHCDGRRRYPLAVARLARLLRRHRIDILHAHHYEETLVGTLAAILARTPALVVGRHYHDELYQVAKGLKLRRLLALEAFCYRVARAIVVPSAAIQRLLVERQGVRADTVHVIPYGFDLGAERYRQGDAETVRAVRRDLGLDGHFIIGNFGRQWFMKGQDYLLRAFAEFVREVPGARLLMVGDGPGHRELRALAERLGVAERVVFTGWRSDASRLMDAVDVVAHPTLSEAFPQVPIEALIRGRPLVLTDVAGAGHIQHMVNGILVPPRDTRRLSDALRWIVGHQEESRVLGERGRAYVRENLDIRKNIGAYEACYDAVARHRWAF